MKYYCPDCSYRGPKSGPNGECPGCGSYTLTRRLQVEDKPPPAKWRLGLLIGLWTYLIIHIIWKLNH